jgi:hypothetical protein
MVQARKLLILELLFILSAIPLPAIASSSGKVLKLQKSPVEIVVDGVIESAWSAADSAVDFFQLSPNYSQPPKYKTVAKLITTEDALYCLILCEQPQEQIEAYTGVHDQASGDVVSLMLDTFGDRQTAYKFAVSSAGVRSDARLVDDARDRDYSWDGVWFSAVRQYDWGYVVEIKVPYRSIRYEGDLSEWGLDFDRWIPVTREDLYWSTYEENEGQRISKFGRLLLNGSRPTAKGLNLEIYPVGLSKATYLTSSGKYKIEPDAGIDIFYNPSEKLTFQLTGNPDFAQIEADPFQFNISRYETYFSERRPFFIEGNEIFTASGRESNTGFYRPLELFYPRRIGKILPDGSRVPLLVGTKASGRADDWQYGGFYALTGEKEYGQDSEKAVERQAQYVAARVKKQILDNSSVGVLLVGKTTPGNINGVVDVDGAFRSSSLQLSYQIARSIDNGSGDFAVSAGLVGFGKTWANLVRLRAIGKNFDGNQVGFVPWQGTAELLGLTGPVTFYEEGPVRQQLILFGAGATYKDAELYWDHFAVADYNLNFRSNWGLEITLIGGKSRDNGRTYGSYETDFSCWMHTSPRWQVNFNGSYGRTYNFARDYLANYGYGSGEIGWTPASILQVGTSGGVYIEQNPEGGTEEITYNARPYVSMTPVNDVNIRMYVDNLFLRSTGKREVAIYGFLVSFNFLPKSWIYLAVNESQDRSDELDGGGNLLPRRLHTTDRAAVLKVKYLYYL